MYFLTIHVPADVVQYLTDLQLMEIYMFGVKVGESSEIDVYMGMHWGIGVPLGMNHGIIEQYIHFMHPLLHHLNGEWFQLSR